MANLAKTEGLHFKRYKSGNIRWYFGSGEYHYWQGFLGAYVLNYTEYILNPLEYAVLKSLYLRAFGSVIAPESIKIAEAEAIAFLWLLRYKGEGDFEQAELEKLLQV